MNESLNALLRSLQAAGLALDAGQAMDSLWLALRMQEQGGMAPTPPPDAADVRNAPRVDGSERSTPSGLPSAPTPATQATVPQVASGTQRFALDDDEVDTLDLIEGRWLTLERTEALSIGRDLARALRPLRRRVQVPGRGRLDVDATVRRAIDEFIFLPSFLPARERWLDVLLVLDHGLSMIVWKETLDAFERVLRTSGAFRSVRSLWLESDTDRPTLSSRGHAAPTGDALQLPTMAHARSRTVVLVVSDCVSPRWHDGSVAALLAAWGATLPVSLLQVTPDWYWPRTALGDAAEGPLFATGELPRNSRLSWSSAAMGLDGLLPGDAGPFAPIPLAAMTAHDIGRVARLLAGGGDGAVRGALFDLSWRGEVADAGAIAPERRVARFHALATDDARRLAAAFASSPVQTLGMLRLLRRDLLPGSRPFVEAEVLLGGLLRVRQEDASWDAGAALRLEFIDGVRALLQDSATVPDILRVLRHASRSAAAGRSATFSAWLSEPELRESGLESLGDDFASAAAPVLRRLGGSYARGVKDVTSRPAAVFGEAVWDRDVFKEERIEANAPAFDVGGEGEVSAEDPAASGSSGSAVGREGSPSDAKAAEQVALRARRAQEVPSAPWFVGREREIESIMAATDSRRRTHMLVRQRTRPIVAWITGAEGIGKSALLAELVREWNEHFDPVAAFYWSFATDSSVDLCLRALADAASRSTMGSDADSTELRAALLGALAGRRQDLMVFDDVDALAADELRRFLDDVSLIAGSVPTTSIVLASRETIKSNVPASQLYLEPLARDAIEEVIRRAVRDPRFDRSFSLPFPESARDQTLASKDLFATLSGGNPAALLALLELVTMGTSVDEIRRRFARSDGSLVPISVADVRIETLRLQRPRDVDAILDRARSRAAEGNLEAAREEAEAALALTESGGAGPPPAAAALARSLDVLGRINLRMGNREEGTRQLQRALRTAYEAGATELVSELSAFLDDRAPRFDDPQVQAVLHVYGRVSGVGYRAWAQRQAQELQLEGSVQNLADGRIRVSASGPQSRVDELEHRLRTGPPGATVTRVTREGEDVATTGADVFLSYAADDREIATRIGELLEGAGLSVFLDQASLEGGDRWREALDAALDRARCIVMLLTRASVTSDWVLRESRRGLQRQILVPVLLEPNVRVPIELEKMSIHDLTTWDRSGTSPLYWNLLAAIVRVVGIDSPAPKGAGGESDVAQDVAQFATEGAPNDGVTAGSEPSAEDPEGRAELHDIGEQEHSQNADTPSDAKSPFDLDTIDLFDLNDAAWVQLPAGTFRMGASDGEERERPEHIVGLSAYRISRFPITNRHYERFLKETGLPAPQYWRGGRMPSGTRDHPVTNVTWDDAAAFCSWLTSQLGSDIAGRAELPTEAQWEYAARGPEGRRFPWGDAEPSKEHANFGRQGGGTVPVNAHPAGATPTGIWDMAGNAWEWCRDWYGAYPSETVENPPGAPRGTVRVIRGGSHQSEPAKLRAAYRANRPPKDIFDRGGFRVVWTAAPASDIPAP